MQQQVERIYGRPSHKHRFGYFEKPSELRRKRNKFRYAQQRSNGILKLHVHPFKALFKRTGPSNALMR
jgi:hypothetical protein